MKTVRIKFLLFAILTAIVLGGGTLIGGTVKADQIQDQINALQQQNKTNQAQADSLATTAASYQQAVDVLNGQISSLQSTIVATQSQIDNLQAQITKAQADLDKEKEVLGANIKTMYLEGNVSTLEVLASSKNLSDFVNKQEYRNSVASKVTESVQKINSLKAQLQQQQREQQSLLKDETAQQAQLQADQSQQTAMLNYTEGQKAAYDQQISANNSQIQSLRAQQAALNRQLGGALVAGDPGHGGYPAKWDEPVGQDSLVDSWGMYNRECVSYTAWKVQQTYGNMPYWGGVGNANQWPGDAQQAGIPTSNTPKVHTVAIWNVGAFGHAMWVEAVNPDGSLWVSQYNYDYQGHYSEMSVSPSMARSLTYIYFGG